MKEEEEEEEGDEENCRASGAMTAITLRHRCTHKQRHARTQKHTQTHLDHGVKVI